MREKLWLIFLLVLIPACSPVVTTQVETASVIVLETVTKTPSLTAELADTPTSLPSKTTTPSETPSPTATLNNIQKSSTPTLVSPESPTPTIAVVMNGSGGLIVDHNSVRLFEMIPEEFLAAARDLKMMYVDQSVGFNISQSLDCLTAVSWDKAPAFCRRDYIGDSWEWKTYSRADFGAGSVPERILFSPDPQKYDRSNWTFLEGGGGEWSATAEKFIDELAPAHLETKDILSYQFTYLNVTSDDDIANSESGYFAANPTRTDIYDLENFVADHPDKTFIYWTTSLSRSIGTDVSTQFNDQMREYALENDLILFDVADIEAHTDLGEPCFDNRDGVGYCNRGGNCENYPDDGVDNLAICQDYTTETDGGHLGSVSAGGNQLAKSFWVLMAMVAGWDGSAQ